MAFAVVTYAAAPVAGFGWLLASMGCAQCAATQIMLRAGYVLVFLVVLVYAETPLVSLILETSQCDIAHPWSEESPDLGVLHADAQKDTSPRSIA